MSRGYVYVLTNPAMPGLVKIGKTQRDPESRAKELHKTGVPTPFSVHDYVLSPNCAELEAMIHQQLDGWRVSESREFFAVSTKTASTTLRGIHCEQMSLLIDEYMPDHRIIDSAFVVDEGWILKLADVFEESVETISSAMSFVTPEELAPALAKWKARIARSQANSEADE